MARRRSSELWLALLAIVLITVPYAYISMNGGRAPDSSGLGGHLLGIVGFFLMVLTELLYAARKRARNPARWGRMESWLQFHTFTGLVGPYMVLLHTSFKFNGLAGAVTLLTLVVVLSGFIGRYIYTAVPRTAEGLEVDGGTMQSQMASNEIQLGKWRAAHTELARALPADLLALPGHPGSNWRLVLGRVFSEGDFRRRWRRAGHRFDRREQSQLAEFGALLLQRQVLRRQASSLALVRRVMALWHAVHVPIGIALFTTAAIHIGVAIYYVSLAR